MGRSEFKLSKRNHYYFIRVNLFFFLIQATEIFEQKSRITWTVLSFGGMCVYWLCRKIGRVQHIWREHYKTCLFPNLDDARMYLTGFHAGNCCTFHNDVFHDLVIQLNVSKFTSFFWIFFLFLRNNILWYKSWLTNLTLMTTKSFNVLKVTQMLLLLHIWLPKEVVFHTEEWNLAKPTALHAVQFICNNVSYSGLNTSLCDSEHMGSSVISANLGGP